MRTANRQLTSWLSLEDRITPAIVSWDGGGGNLLWSNPLNWSSNQLPGAADDVIIGDAFADVDITLGFTTKVASVTSKSDIFITSAGTLDVSGADPDVAIVAPSLTLSGTLRNSITAANTPVFVNNGGVLDGVTVNGLLRVGFDNFVDTYVAVIGAGGLTLNGTADLGRDFSRGQLSFTGSQTLNGTGSVVFSGVSNNGLYAAGSGTLTIGSGITISGLSGFVGTGTSTVVNNGRIVADVFGGFINLFGNHPVSAGTLDDANGGTLFLAGTITGPGTVPIGANASLRVGGIGRLVGVTVDRPVFVDDGGVLDGVTVNGLLRVGFDNFVDTYVAVIGAGGLTLNGTADLGRDFSRGQLSFTGSQTLNGTGSVVFSGVSDNGLYAAGSGTLTIGSGITVSGLSGFVGNTGKTINNGLIHSNGGGTITTRGTFTNIGELRATGGTLDARNLTNLDGNGVLNGGTYTSNANGQIRFSREITALAANFTLGDPSATVVVNNTTAGAFVPLTGITTAGALNLRGGTDLGLSSLTNQGTLSLGVGSVLSLTGAFDNRGTFNTQISGGSAAGGFGRLTTDGGAILAGKLEAVPVGTGFQLNDSYRLIDAKAGRTREFTELSVAGNNVLYDGTGVSLGIPLTPPPPPPPPPPPDGSGNASPVANADLASTSAGISIVIPVLQNDSDPDNDPLALQSVTAPANGQVSQSGNQVIYTPNVGFIGTDSFTYTITDGRGGTSSATVTIAVNSRPTPPRDQQLVVIVGVNVQVYVTQPGGGLSQTGSFRAFPGIGGVVRGAVGDFDGDGQADQAVVTGPGGGGFLRILGANGGDLLGITDLFPGENLVNVGLFVAAGDINGDGRDEIIVTPDLGGGPRVRVFQLNGGQLIQLADYFGIDDPNFRGGARVGVGDLDGDNQAELVVSAGFGGGPRIAIFSGASVTNGSPSRLVNDFFAFESTLRNGAFVTVGDFDGDGRGELVFGGGPGGGPRVLSIRYSDLLASGSDAAIANSFANLFAFDAEERGGVRLAVKDVDGDGRLDLITGSGEGQSPGVRVFRSLGNTLSTSPSDDLSFGGLPTAFGVFVG
ncbi:beta strand repeat-containing protein [Tuwongella immobilis]|uniref:Cadherin-like domain-containing protein n=1 Tax=Tuwongella immobilis TaxID=692036 RepID=A0A6C2YXX3_9BACT|nr:Ig-like domain-containing protein [Tuwongella immobilis]VIP05642.1 na-ca exchanger integrin-beta4 : Hemolysin-type calcium-binding region domain protein OS=Rhodopirellula maiorica SM1 GN=RMSM_03614 PE=4 SV=1: VCBS [Tuwongella immobilis]VTS08640.1 na-ca exchanger integrin-beta4 : Hemolysin-type calcium-binding region domain protein OS=Rhodopirellula maiorica SM1 GN=RMSM_03614 PE=4 SV=1: VCBS [Tuwongella immobilis]